MNEPLRYFFELDGQSMEARSVHGREALSTPWRFELTMPLAVGAWIDPDHAVRRRAAVVIARGAEVARHIEGIVTECDLRITATGGPELRVIVEPTLVEPRYRRDIRVFRDKDAVQIVEEVLALFGIAVERRLSDVYVSRPYCVQMRESDLDFCHRLLEDEGIAYFVCDDGTVVLCDSPSAHPALAEALHYAPPSSLEAQHDALLEVAERAELTVGEVSLRDFNPDHPSLAMDVSAAVPGSRGPEHYDFPGEYVAPAEGAIKAQRTAESFAAHAAGIEGRSSSGRLAHGHVVELEGARGVDDGAYLITAVVHAFERDAQGFTNRFEAVAKTTVWRPLRRTHVPQLANPLTGVVTGPPGADVHTNELGRVKVHFRWDRRQPMDDGCSDWVPVLQDNTGHSVAMPRIGWEVLVHFLEGDPDRPVVLGRLYNGADPFPEPLPEGKTRSALRSLSSPTRDGLNMLRFDDSAGSELLTIHAEKDQTIAIARDERIDIGATEQAVIGHDEVVSVGTDATTLVGGNRTEHVVANQTWEVGGDRTLEVKGARTANVTGDHARTIGGAHKRRIEGDDIVDAARLREKVGAVIVETSVASNSIQAGMAGTLTVGGAIVELARKDKTESAKLGRIETIGGVVLSKANATTTASAKLHAVTVGGALSVSAATNVSFDAGAKMQIAAAAAAFAHPASITLKVGGASVVIGEGVVAITAPGKIVFRVSGPNQQQSSESTQI